ncbi:MAG: DNA polymerase III subunit alpha [Propionibacteriaceae bacterium]|nr:DNA polymerase III subunit alpha [Propionibacteriaceae bacterium]
MNDPFVHLRVASGYSLQYGASSPAALVEAAAAAEMDTLALTDRGGLYGAIRFATACARSGIAPVVGADLAMAPLRPAARRRPSTPAKGGAVRDVRLPRAVVLATSRIGWASLCRLLSATHAAGQRGEPVCTHELIGAHGRDLLVMLGADSRVGAALGAGDEAAAEAELVRWRDVVEPHQLVLAVTHHQVPGTGPGSGALAGRMLAWADRHRVVGVLSHDVRMAAKHLAPTLDVLDSARRLVPLDSRNVDRRNAEGYLKSGKEMMPLAETVSALAGRRDAEQLIADTRMVAIRSRLDPRADIGLGEIHLPEFEVLGGTGGDAAGELYRRCEAGLTQRYGTPDGRVLGRLAEELDIINHLGFASYFLTVADVTVAIRELGIRSAARGSGAGSLVNYLLGISGVDPIRHGLLMERFLSPLRAALPDIDLDVESARRTEVYDKILELFGTERVACVAMVDTYRVRHAVRDVGAALSLPPREIDAIATAFPHIRARDARAALRDLPELRAAGLGEKRLDVLFCLVESLDGLPRHLALHPCGVLLSDRTLGDRTPIEASFGGYPMSQFDKDDVEAIGLLKLDVLGIRMQSSIAHALGEIQRVEGERVDLDILSPYDDPQTYDMIAKSVTLGCFQIESPGQRELIGKFGPADFGDIIIDISLFRPGPVKSGMVIPFLEARQGWRKASYLHPDLEPVLAETGGVVVFHEQIIQIIAVVTGCTLAQGDEARRALGNLQAKEDVKRWFFPAASRRGYSAEVIGKIWFILESFASFGFCKAHAAAFALPTYQSAWLKAHYPAHFLAGVLTHDPGMYPKRLILEEARRLGVEILGLDVNRSEVDYRVEKLEEFPPGVRNRFRMAGSPEMAGEPLSDPAGVARYPVRLTPGHGLPDGRGYGIRLGLADVKGISQVELTRIVAGRPYASLTDFWRRTGNSSPVTERLVLAGAFDELYDIGSGGTVGRRGRVTRRDLLLSVSDLERAARVDRRGAGRARGLGVSGQSGDAGRRAEIQLPLEFVSAADRGDVVSTGLPELSDSERLAAELEIIGLDASHHVLSDQLEFLTAVGVTFSADLLSRRSRSEVLIAGVKVATQTPPVRSGRRVIFLTLDDSTGPADATFFEDVQGPYAATVFGCWQLVVRGELRRAGPRGVSVLANGCWDLTQLQARYSQVFDETGDAGAALAAVQEVMAVVPEGFGVGDEAGRRRMLVHPSGFRQSPYADVKPAGGSVEAAPRKLWHSSPGSAGR